MKIYGLLSINWANNSISMEILRFVYRANPRTIPIYSGYITMFPNVFHCHGSLFENYRAYLKIKWSIIKSSPSKWNELEAHHIFRQSQVSYCRLYPINLHDPMISRAKIPISLTSPSILKSHDISMNSLKSWWNPMKSPWNPHEIPMKSPWIPWNPHEIFIKPPWNTHKIPMKSPWNLPWKPPSESLIHINPRVLPSCHDFRHLSGPDQSAKRYRVWQSAASATGAGVELARAWLMEKGLRVFCVGKRCFLLRWPGLVFFAPVTSRCFLRRFLGVFCDGPGCLLHCMATGVFCDGGVFCAGKRCFLPR